MFGNLGFLNEFDFRDNYTYIKIKKEDKYQYEDAETDRSNGVRPLLIDHAFIEDCRIKAEEEIEIKPDVCSLLEDYKSFKNELPRLNDLHRSITITSPNTCNKGASTIKQCSNHSEVESCKLNSPQRKTRKTRKDRSVTEWFNCDSCDFRTKQKCYLKCHMLSHKAPSEIEWFRCALCDFKSKRKSHLIYHMPLHKNPSGIEWFECDSCEYKSKRKDYLQKHITLVHKDPSEINWFICDVCSYKSKQKNHLKGHMLIHRKPSEIEWFRCSECDYKSKRKNDLKKHIDELEKNGLVMCKSCSNKVKVLFDFKAACLYTEDFITPFVDEEAKNRIELKELFLKEKGYDGELAFILCNKSLCRLCMGLADVGCLCLEGRDPHVNFVKDRIKKCIPEVNVDNTRDAVVCDACVESLKDYSDFLDLCLRLKKNNDFQIKTEEIQIETLECNLLEDSQKVFNESDQFKYRTESTQDELHSNVLKLNECDDKASIFPVPVELLEDGLKYCKPQQINLKTRRNQDQLRKRYKCHLCDYKAKHQCDLKRHMLVHKHSSEIEWLKCPLCDHKTKRKENLKGHMLVHKHPAETKWFSCHLCTYRANKKYVLTAHMLVHKDPTEIKWFKCDLCNYKSKTNGNLRRHTLVHKDLSQMEVKWLKCDECEYRSRYRFSLAKHIEAHKDPSEIAWLRCDSCGFKAKVKSHLKSHIMLVHRDSAEVEWFKCNLCNFKSKYGNSLRNHLSVHKDPTEVKWFVCGLCGFTTKQKGNLKRHMRTIHKIINILKL